MFRGFFGESILRRAAAMGAATIRKVFDIEGVEDLGAGTFSADAAQSECGGGRRRQGEVHGDAEGRGACGIIPVLSISIQGDRK